MIQVQEIIRAGAVFECVRPMLIEPGCIELAQPGEVSGYDGNVCRLRIVGVETFTFITGTIENLHHAIQGAEVLASERLAAIREIIGDGT